MSDAKNPKRGPAPIGRTVLLVVCIVLVAVLLALFVLFAATDMFGMRRGDEQLIELNIPEGTSSGQIASALQQAGVINQGLTFRLYAGLIRQASSQFQAGTYVFDSKMGYDEIIIMLRSGNVSIDTVTLTFYEGSTLREIARKLEQNGVCSASDFIAATENADFGYEFMNMLPEKQHIFRRLEGYLYPDTYEFYVGENVNSVLRKFLLNFSQKIFPEVYDEILDAGFTLDEALTLASIIQKEAGEAGEMRRVSSVFHNRLGSAEFPRLESDVTIFYVEGNIKPYMQTVNQPLYDAYNTYVRAGLPEGPICSPGMDAIKAALQPEDTVYLFFVTDKAGEYYYATTLREHDRNVAVASRAGVDHGTATGS